MAGENGLRRKDQRGGLTAKAVVDRDAGNHVHTVQNASKLRTQQPSPADESLGESVSTPKRSFT